MGTRLFCDLCESTVKVWDDFIWVCVRYPETDKGSEYHICLSCADKLDERLYDLRSEGIRGSKSLTLSNLNPSSDEVSTEEKA